MDRFFYEDLQDTMIPEMLRSDLCGSILALLQLGVRDSVHFDYVDPPPVLSLKRGLEALHYLGEISDDGEITRMEKPWQNFR